MFVSSLYMNSIVENKCWRCEWTGTEEKKDVVESTGDDELDKLLADLNKPSTGDADLINYYMNWMIWVNL